MRMRILVLAVLPLAGCEAVFKLEGPPDAVPACASPNTHDEDGDRIPDDCDLCPADPTPTGDTDGDGVGDACDPQPAIPCEHRVLFDGFGTPTNPPIKVGFAYVQDDLNQGEPGFDRGLIHFPGPFDDVIVRAAFFVADDAFGTPQNGSPPPQFDISSGVTVTGQINRTAGYACRLTHVSDTQLNVDIVNLNNDGPVATPGSFNGDGTDNIEETVFEFHNAPDGTLSCKISGTTGQGSTAAMVGAVASMGEVAIGLHFVSARAHWIEVIANTCPP